jgi:hypothetical protein
VQIKSITAYREMTWDDLLDIDGSPIDAFHSGRGIESDQTSQELQILASTDRVNYVLGYYGRPPGPIDPACRQRRMARHPDGRAGN